MSSRTLVLCVSSLLVFGLASALVYKHLQGPPTGVFFKFYDHLHNGRVDSAIRMIEGYEQGARATVVDEYSAFSKELREGSASIDVLEWKRSGSIYAVLYKLERPFLEGVDVKFFVRRGLRWRIHNYPDPASLTVAQRSDVQKLREWAWSQSDTSSK